MKSYVFEKVKINGTTFITKWNNTDFLLWSIMKFLLFLFIVWPFEIFIVIPFLFIGKLFLALCEFILRGLWWLFIFLLRCVWWLIKLPFCLLFKRSTPNF